MAGGAEELFRRDQLPIDGTVETCPVLQCRPADVAGKATTERRRNGSRVDIED